MAKDTRSAIVVGTVGSGKSTLMNELVHQWDGMTIVVQHNMTGHRSVEKQWPGVIVREPEEMQEITNQQDSWDDVKDLAFHYVSPETGPEVMEGLQNFALSVANESDGEVPILFSVDEVQSVLPDDGKQSARAANPLTWILMEGRSPNIHAMIGTQDPQELYYPPIKSIRQFYWVGPIMEFHRGFLHFYDLPTDHDEFPTRDYEWVKMFPRLGMEVLDSGITKEEFGESKADKKTAEGVQVTDSGGWWPF